MSEWRDAVPQGVVWLPLDQIDRVRPDAYEKMYREYLESLINSTTNHRQLLFGHVFFEPRALEGKGQEAGDGRPSEQSSRKKVVFATVLRHPILRLASQYDFDRVQAKSKVYQEQVRRSKGVQPFLDCARNETCRSINEFGRWCNLQTRYFCGFSGDCKSDESGGPTEQMVKRARENMMRSFKFIGILEDWNSTVRVLEAVLPTLAEGISDASRGGDEKHCAKSWFGLSRTSCQGVKNRNDKRDRSVEEKIIQEDVLPELRKLCWGDLELYELARRRLKEQAKECLE